LALGGGADTNRDLGLVAAPKIVESLRTIEAPAAQ
jgi:hypothetical protein